MQHGAGDTTTEVDRFGPRLHGSVRGTTLTMPSGNTVSSSANESTAAVSGVAGPYGLIVSDTDNDVYLKNYAVLSWEYKSGPLDTRMCGRSMPGNGAPYVAPSGRVWWVRQVDTLDTNAASWLFEAQTFGVFGDDLDPGSHLFVVTNPVAGDPDYANTVARLGDVRRDGARWILSIGATARGWVELTVSEVSATQVTASAAVVRTWSQTRGAYSETSVAAYGDLHDLRSPLFSVTLTDSDPPNAHYEYLVEAGEWHDFGSPAAGGSTGLSENVVTGYIVGMLYDASGALEEILADVETRTSYSIAATALTVTGEGQSATWEVDNNITSGQTFTFTAQGTSAWTIAAEVRHRVRKAGQTVIESVNQVTTHFSEPIAWTVEVAPNPVSANPPDYPKFRSRRHTSVSWSRVLEYIWHGVSNYQDDETITAPGSWTLWTASAQMSQMKLGVETLLGSSAGTIGFSTSEPELSMLLGLQYCLPNTPLVSWTHVAHRGYARMMRRTASLFSAPGAVFEESGTASIHAWESAVAGRGGLVESQPFATSAVLGGSPTQVAWSLPHISEEPVTGSVIRGGTTSERVGWV